MVSLWSCGASWEEIKESELIYSFFLIGCISFPCLPGSVANKQVLFIFVHAGNSFTWWNTFVRLWRQKDMTVCLSFHQLWQGEYNRVYNLYIVFKCHKLNYLSADSLCISDPNISTTSSGQPGMFGREEFEQLAPVVDGFSLMTYDYSNAGRWGFYILQCHSNILTGLDTMVLEMVQRCKGFILTVQSGRSCWLSMKTVCLCSR